MSYIFKRLLSLTILTDYKNRRKSDNGKTMINYVSLDSAH